MGAGQSAVIHTSIDVLFRFFSLIATKIHVLLNDRYEDTVRLDVYICFVGVSQAVFLARNWRKKKDYATYVKYSS